MPADQQTSGARRIIHVLVVDDSAVVRQTITALLHSQADIRTTIAADPLIAIEKMKRDRPDVIVLDLEMPRMDGLTFLRKIMAEEPTPVIVCSGYVGEGSEQAMRALDSGAVELITKPKVGLQAFLHETAVTLVDAIRAAALYKMPARRRPAPSDSHLHAAPERRLAPPQLIAIGSSTGGPEALRKILPAMDQSTCGIVVVQHMPEIFTASFARHLNAECRIEVKEAESGDEIRAGRALIAPGDRHMEVIESRGRLCVDICRGPLVSRHRPSVDVLFRSVARSVAHNAVGIILTGMGGDGADGLREMHDAGAYTIAQDESSCAVFGMPRAAIKRRAVDHVLPLDEIAPALISVFIDYDR